MSIARLRKEYVGQLQDGGNQSQNGIEEDVPFTDLAPIDDDNLFHWNATLNGVAGTSYDRMFEAIAYLAVIDGSFRWQMET